MNKQEAEFRDNHAARLQAYADKFERERRTMHREVFITGSLAPISAIPTAETRIRRVPTYSFSKGWTVYEASLATYYRPWPTVTGYHASKDDALRAAG